MLVKKTIKVIVLPPDVKKEIAAEVHSLAEFAIQYKDKL